MNINFKNIHVGQLIRLRVEEKEIETRRICNFLKCNEDDINKMYESKDLETNILLRWSKLLEYDFFRIYTQHLILYTPPSSASGKETSKKSQKLPTFKKNIYTKEIIEFILDMVNKGEKTKLQITQEYKIPKITLHNWIAKYKQNQY